MKLINMLNIQLFFSCQEINNLKRLNIKIFIILIVKKKLNSKIDHVVSNFFLFLINIACTSNTIFFY